MIPPMCIYIYGVSTVSIVADISMFSVFCYFCVFIWKLVPSVFWFHICLILLYSLLLMSFCGHDVSMFDIFVCVFVLVILICFMVSLLSLHLLVFLICLIYPILVNVRVFTFFTSFGVYLRGF